MTKADPENVENKQKVWDCANHNGKRTFARFIEGMMKKKQQFQCPRNVGTAQVWPLSACSSTLYQDRRKHPEKCGGGWEQESLQKNNGALTTEFIYYHGYFNGTKPYSQTFYLCHFQFILSIFFNWVNFKTFIMDSSVPPYHTDIRIISFLFSTFATFPSNQRHLFFLQ